MVLRIETDQAGEISDCPTGLLEGRPIRHAKYISTVEYRRHQEERSDPFGQGTDAGPFIALALEELANYFPDAARVLCVGPREGATGARLRARASRRGSSALAHVHGQAAAGNRGAVRLHR